MEINLPKNTEIVKETIEITETINFPEVNSIYVKIKETRYKDKYEIMNLSINEETKEVYVNYKSKKFGTFYVANIKYFKHNFLLE